MKVMSRTLSIIRDSTGSQCSSRRAGLMFVSSSDKTCCSVLRSAAVSNKIRCCAKIWPKFQLIIHTISK